MPSPLSQNTRKEAGRRQRTLRVFLRIVIAALIVLLIILIGAAATHGAVPLFPGLSG